MSDSNNNLKDIALKVFAETKKVADANQWRLAKEYNRQSVVYRFLHEPATQEKFVEGLTRLPAVEQSAQARDYQELYEGLTADARSKKVEMAKATLSFLGRVLSYEH